MADMFVVQLVLYFHKGLSKEECSEAMEPLLEDTPLSVRYMGTPENGMEAHSLQFFDNCSNFDPEEIKPKVKRVMHDDRIRILDYIVWEMDTEEPDDRLTKGV